MDLVTYATDEAEDLPDAAPALWALVPDPASMVLLVLALAIVAGPALPA